MNLTKLFQLVIISRVVTSKRLHPNHTNFRPSTANIASFFLFFSLFFLFFFFPFFFRSNYILEWIVNHLKLQSLKYMCIFIYKRFIMLRELLTLVKLLNYKERHKLSNSFDFTLWNGGLMQWTFRAYMLIIIVLI